MISEAHSAAARQNLQRAQAALSTRKREQSPHWKGGRYIGPDGYVYVRVWDATGRGKPRLEHRVVMEQVVGRPLKRRENVHHKNGDKTDNRPGNLEIIMVDEHARLHSAPHAARLTKFTESQVAEIRRLRATNAASYAEIAAKFGISKAHIYRLVSGQLRTPKEYGQ